MIVQKNFQLISFFVQNFLFLFYSFFLLPALIPLFCEPAGFRPDDFHLPVIFLLLFQLFHLLPERDQLRLPLHHLLIIFFFLHLIFPGFFFFLPACFDPLPALFDLLFFPAQLLFQRNNTLQNPFCQIRFFSHLFHLLLLPCQPFQFPVCFLQFFQPPVMISGLFSGNILTIRFFLQPPDFIRNRVIHSLFSFHAVL